MLVNAILKHQATRKSVMISKPAVIPEPYASLSGGESGEACLKNIDLTEQVTSQNTAYNLINIKYFDPGGQSY